MRLRRRDAPEEAPPERASVEDIDRLFPDVERRSTVPEPELTTAAERAAARRRLDRLADEF